MVNPFLNNLCHQFYALPGSCANRFVSRSQVWERITYFLDRAIPVANEYKIRLACHPQYPKNQRFLFEHRQRSYGALYRSRCLDARSRISGYQSRIAIQLILRAMIAMVLQRQVAGDRKQIGLQRTFRPVEPFRRANIRQKALLRDILGRIRPVRQTADETEHRAVILIECLFCRHAGPYIKNYRETGWKIPAGDSGRAGEEKPGRRDSSAGPRRSDLTMYE
jgi:hypothetical protein